MKIVIAGAGEVGSHLAKLLSREDQDVILVDKKAERLDIIDAHYNLMTMVGSPTSFEVLRDARVGSCDLFIAVTPYEAENMNACAIAKYYGAKKTVARIDNYGYMNKAHRDFFAAIGVNYLIYPEYLAAREIDHALRRNWVRNWLELHDGRLIVVGVKLREGAELVGMQLKDLPRHNSFHVSAIKRNHRTIIPRGIDTIEPGDIVYFTITPDQVEALRQSCGKRLIDIRKVAIMGGGRIAARLVNMTGDRYKYKIIEMDRRRCDELAEECPHAIIINGDGRDIDLLADENVNEYDAFVALTGSSETNILACLTAKELGVGKTIAEVENIQFISEAENLNIGTIVNKKLLASSKIFQTMLEADTESSKFMALADADVAEIEARPGSKITRAQVKDLNLSHDMTIAGLIRDGEGMLVTGGTQIRPGDHVVVFCLQGVIHKVERLFI